jgi:hypothetical protein
MKKDDELRRKLAETFEDFEAEPQAETWENIRKAIRPKRKKRAIWLFWGLGCLAFLVGLGLYALQTPALVHAPNQQPASETTKAVSPDQNPESVQSSEKEISLKNTPRRGGGSTENQPNSPVISARPSAKQPKAVSPTALSELKVGAQIPGIKVEQDAKMQGLEPELEALTAPLQTPAPMPEFIPEAKPVSIQILSPLPLQAIPVVAEDKKLPSGRFGFSMPVAKQSSRTKGKFTAGVTLLSTYQIMQSQANNGLRAADIRVLPALDAHRLGSSWSVGYQLPLRRNSDLHAAITWMNLPYRAEYSVNNTHQLNIEILSATQYRVSPHAVGEVSTLKRLNYLGFQLDYGHSFKLFDRKIRAFSGGEGLWSVADSKPELWALAGLNIPLGLWKFQLAPVFKYRFNRIEQADQLVKTRLYTLGLGIQTTF